MATWDVTLTVAGNNAVLNVTGVAGHDIDWVATIERIEAT
jgi:hypothetical protein